MKFIIIPLAQRKMQKRGISLVWVEETIRAPDQKVAGYSGRMVYQKRYVVSGKEQLLRVICEEDMAVKTVVTAYLTSDASRYWGV